MVGGYDFHDFILDVIILDVALICLSTTRQLNLR